VAMFLAIQSSRTQLDVLTAAAKIELTASDYELFDAIMNVRYAVEKERNNLAHGLIGESMIVKEGILWISQRDLTEHTARVWYEGLDPVDSSITKAHTFVYEPEDLETIAQNMEWLHQVIGVFRGYISSENAQWRAARYHQLCADPRIAKELSRMRGRKRLVRAGTIILLRSEGALYAGSGIAWRRNSLAWRRARAVASNVAITSLNRRCQLTSA
jgi:hypothetical protein